jgi:hypothetical protein
VSGESTESVEEEEDMRRCRPAANRASSCELFHESSAVDSSLGGAGIEATATRGARVLRRRSRRDGEVAGAGEVCAIERRGGEDVARTMKMVT